MSFSARDMKQRRHARRQLMTEINMAPFVDVMLVLIVILMVAVPPMKFGLEVDVPTGDFDPVPDPTDPLVVNISADGEIYLGDSLIEPDQLTTRLAAIAEENSDLQIFLRADRNLTYERVMNVVDMIKNAGLTKIALITEVRDVDGPGR